MSADQDVVSQRVGHVGTVEICRPPLNFLDIPLITQIADALEAFDRDDQVRCVVLSAQGKAFCAGADFSGSALKGAGGSAETADPMETARGIYEQAVRIFKARKPVVAAVQGAAIGGGLGLALAADFRVTCHEARFSANFTKLGFHPGFGLTVTLPELIGRNHAELLLYTSRRLSGEEALRLGLVNDLVPQEQVRHAAMELAGEIAGCSPLGLLSTRATMRQGLAERVLDATRKELAEQALLLVTDDFKEGVRATEERRTANFRGC